MTIEEMTFSAQDYVYVEGDVPMTNPEQIAEAMGVAFGKASAFLQSTGITPLSSPICVYTEMPGEKMTFRCGFFVSSEDAMRTSDEVRADQIPACSALHTIHVGPYTNMNQTHSALWAHAKANGLTSAMPVWEIYIDDPNETEQSTLRTEIYHALG